LPARRGIYAWEFERNGRELKVRVDGQLVFNTAALILNAALGGFGLAYLTEQQVTPHLESGELVRVLANWCPPFSGYHLYYPSRRQPSAAFCHASRSAALSRHLMNGRRRSRPSQWGASMVGRRRRCG
jgi:DNA-binding transcriptional LysR family regulator